MDIEQHKRRVEKVGHPELFRKAMEYHYPDHNKEAFVWCDICHECIRVYLGCSDCEADDYGLEEVV